MLPKLFAKRFLGIDIGTSAVRIVELEKTGSKPRLSNFGEIYIHDVENEIPGIASKANLALSTDEVAEMIQAVLLEAKIKTRQCAFSIPDFSTFFTSFTLPPMTKQELPAAVMFEARQHIPLPLESVTVDWQLISGNFNSDERMGVIVTAIPNEIITQYKEIATKAKLEVSLMEAEVFGLLQSLVPNEDNRSICIVDIGTQSTVCSLVEKRIARASHSFEMGGDYLAAEVLKRLPIKPEMAESIKQSYGIKILEIVDAKVKEKIKVVLGEALTSIFKVIELMLNDHYRTGNSEVAKFILSGGISTMPEIKEQFENYFKKEVEVADPFIDLDRPQAIELELKKKGPVYAVATGMARRGLEFIK